MVCVPVPQEMEEGSAALCSRVLSESPTRIALSVTSDSESASLSVSTFYESVDGRF